MNCPHFKSFGGWWSTGLISLWLVSVCGNEGLICGCLGEGLAFYLCLISSLYGCMENFFHHSYPTPEFFLTESQSSKYCIVHISSIHKTSTKEKRRVRFWFLSFFLPVIHFFPLLSPSPTLPPISPPQSLNVLLSSLK